jgi:hypothetical protein
LSHDGSLPIRLSASNIPLRHSGIRSKLQFGLYTTGRVSTLLLYGPHKRTMTLIEAAKMPDRLTKPSSKRPTRRSPRNLPRSHRHGVPGETDLDTSPVGVRSVRTSNIYTSLTHRGCQERACPWVGSGLDDLVRVHRLIRQIYQSRSPASTFSTPPNQFLWT